MGRGEESDRIAAAVAGDRNALVALLRKYGPDVGEGLRINSAWRRLLDPADVMQVTYLEAFLRIGQLATRTHAGFSAWLKQLARNNLRDAIKGLERQKRPDPRRQVPPPTGDQSWLSLLDELAASDQTGSWFLARKESLQMLQEALTRLPPAYRQVVRLCDLEGQSAAEAAAALSRSPGAVHMLRARAHDRLRELLGSPAKILYDSP